VDITKGLNGQSNFCVNKYWNYKWTQICKFFICKFPFSIIAIFLIMFPLTHYPHNKKIHVNQNQILWCINPFSFYTCIVHWNQNAPIDFLSLFFPLRMYSYLFIDLKCLWGVTKLLMSSTNFTRQFDDPCLHHKQIGQFLREQRACS
jgi:hypothetical protein